MTRLLTLLRLSRLFARGVGGDKIFQPIAVTNADGDVLTTEDGTVLVRGTRRMRYIRQPIVVTNALGDVLTASGTVLTKGKERVLALF